MSQEDDDLFASFVGSIIIGVGFLLGYWMLFSWIYSNIHPSNVLIKSSHNQNNPCISESSVKALELRNCKSNRSPLRRVPERLISD